MFKTRLAIEVKNQKEPIIVDVQYNEIKDFLGNMYHAFADRDYIEIKNIDTDKTERYPIADIKSVEIVMFNDLYTKHNIQ